MRDAQRISITTTVLQRLLHFAKDFKLIGQNMHRSATLVCTVCVWIFDPVQVLVQVYSLEIHW